jgi:hypothetical protein
LRKEYPPSSIRTPPGAVAHREGPDGPQAGAERRRQTVDGALRDRVVAECRQEEQEAVMGVGSGPAGTGVVRGGDQFRPGQAGTREVAVVPCDQIGLVPVRVLHEVVDALLALDGAVDDVESVTCGKPEGEGRPVAAPPQPPLEAPMVGPRVVRAPHQPARVALSAGVEVPCQNNLWSRSSERRAKGPSW